MFVQNQITSGYENTSRKWKISTAETKIILVLCYYAVFGIVAMSYMSVEIGDQEDEITAITDYFVCEATGSDNGVECDRSGFDHFGYHGLIVLVYWLLGLIPVINLVFVINWSVTKESVRRNWMKYSKGNFITLISSVPGKQTSTITETGV